MENRGDPAETLESLIDFSTYHDQTQVELDTTRPPTAIISGDSKMSYKKLFHNASERNRRKKINDLYSTLRSLIPGADEMVYYIYMFFFSMFFIILVNVLMINPVVN